MTYAVIISPEARTDLADLFDYLVQERGEAFARAYVQAIFDFCQRFDLFPARGTQHDEIRPGVRVIGYKRRASIAFRIEGQTVTIMRILYGGRSFAGSHDRSGDDDAN
jgi:toxin ParE1/3/4